MAVGTPLTARAITGAPAFGDETLLFDGPIASGGTTLETVIVLVRDGRYVHIWLTVGLAVDPSPDVIAVGERVFTRPAPVEAPPASRRRRGCWLGCRTRTICRPDS